MLDAASPLALRNMLRFLVVITDHGALSAQGMAGTFAGLKRLASDTSGRPETI
ncbi:hypothetical protein NK553_19505 [Pseudomonas sp. ZM23]|uniref:Uncharacterized protein n=1 Tax=Pseudomonas triclosanedens TaxID=2961893 RepID=A0ABY6ZQN1_9PSED|nr:hypothetical protein [Pseudomonas triclosanedens]MCP8466144.1 hypothetical protein [Pseudomonas triclosanedens]MCP8472379.1 hypothetical protein [Pseudomonas triclosanedens]MCP8477443.1 hypothetical protein [Pseudomonas triclosanedens]WAI47224.1 hypothetical protein OU419_15710 [Pseudomonas triclosanedens]